jgi:hypothetical protein
VFGRKLLPATLRMAVGDYDVHYPPTFTNNNFERLERLVMSCQPRTQTERLQRLSAFIPMRIAWSEHLTTRALRLAGNPNVRRKEKEKKNQFALLRLNNSASHGVQMTRDRSSL